MNQDCSKTLEGVAGINCEHVRLYLPGKLFDPIDDTTVECKVLGLSALGAIVQCKRVVNVGARLVLYVEGFGRFDAQAISYGTNECALQFSLGLAKRSRVSDALSVFMKDGVVGLTEFRQHHRVPTIGSGVVALKDGREMTYQVVDISLDGVCLETNLRPEIGEIVKLGKSWGQVVRHHQTGIAIQYIKAAASTAA